MAINAKSLEKDLDRRAKLKKEFKKLKSEIDALEGSLKSMMLTEGLDELDIGTYKITYKDVISNKFDLDTFKVENEDAYNAYLKPSTCKRLYVK